MNDESFRKLERKYKKKLEKSLNFSDMGENNELSSSDFLEFKKQSFPKRLTLYEKMCNLFDSIIKIEPGKENKRDYEEAIEQTHLQITPSGAISFAVLFPIIICSLIIAGAFGISIVMDTSLDLFLVLSVLVMGIAMIMVFMQLPLNIANKKRTRASNQMILGVFYTVSYMRHTSNLELAVEFAANHLPAPLSLDFRKVLWDLETGKFSNIKDSLAAYLETWRRTNLEFIQAFNLIQGSLMESNEERRVMMLDRAVSVLMDETYDKMLHYAHSLKSPITTLHMFGIIMPLLGLVILPLVVGFIEEVRWYHISILYNIVLPVSLYYMAKKILSVRPAGSSEVDVSFIQADSRRGLVLLISIVCIIIAIIGILPPVLYMSIGEEGAIALDQRLGVLKLFDYRTNDLGETIGPFGTLSVLISILTPLGIAFLIGFKDYFRTKKLVQVRGDIIKLEQEFSSALFQLGNRLDDGIPVEMALENVAGIMKETNAGKFFGAIAMNIRRLGLGVYNAIFDQKVGAIRLFPSSIIESSMKVLIQTIKKGPKTAAVAIMNVSKYIQEMHRINERLKDMLSEVSSSISSQVRFIAPIIAGIVVGLTSMITLIMGKIRERVMDLGMQGAETGGVDYAGNIMSMFSSNITPFHFQLIVGIYIVQVTIIMSQLYNAIQNGEDKIYEKFCISDNLIKGVLLYAIIAFFITLIFGIVGATIAVGF